MSRTKPPIWLLPALEGPLAEAEERMRTLPRPESTPMGTTREAVLVGLQLHSGHWYAAAVGWLEQGFPIDAEIAALIEAARANRRLPQKARHRAAALARAWRRSLEAKEAQAAPDRPPADPGMPREYRYVGPAALAVEARADIDRLQPQSQLEIREWSLARGRKTLELTYTVNVEGALWLSDRRTEHVACAQGAPVLGAGEITLVLGRDDVEVAAITNQSTGYCPDPACWTAVHAALVRAGLRPPLQFSHTFDFRRCEGCGMINVVKEEVYECGTCGAELPEAWNLDRALGTG